jgi:hypothetical protein
MMPWESVRELMQFVPFLSLANRPKEQEGKTLLTHPLTVRLMEAAIIAGVVLYGTVQGAEVKLQHIYLELQELKQDVNEIKQQLRLVEQEQWRRRGLDKLAWTPSAYRSDWPSDQP